MGRSSIWGADIGDLGLDMTDTLPMPAGNVIHINAGGITLKIRSP